MSIFRRPYRNRLPKLRNGGALHLTLAALVIVGAFISTADDADYEHRPTEHETAVRESCRPVPLDPGSETARVLADAGWTIHGRGPSATATKPGCSRFGGN